MRDSSMDEYQANIPKRPNNYPTMIFCNPNAGYAEYFQY